MWCQTQPLYRAGPDRDRSVHRLPAVTESDIALFAGWSWDTNPVHTDEVVASQTPFGGRVAHGLIGLSMAMGLISRLDIFED